MMKKTMLLALAMVTVTGFSQMAQAVEPDDAIAYRKNVMAAVGAHMGGLSMALKGQVDDPRALAAHADMLAKSAGLALQPFKTNTAGKGREKTTATADVWQKWPEFEKQMKAFEQQAAKVASVAANGPKATAAELGALGKACKSCHDSFRQKK